MSNKEITEAALERQLRRTLCAVAGTVQEAPDATPSTLPRRRRHRRRRLLVGLGAIAIAAPLAAGAIIGFGPEYVDKLPPANVIVAGEVDGERYWMVEAPATHTDQCGQPFPGVEIVVEERNIIGQERNSTGYSYGEERPPNKNGGGGCGYDTTEAMANPAISFSSGTNIDDGHLWVYAVHPDITAVRVSIGGDTQNVAVHPVDGAGYAVIELPGGTFSYTVELLINGDVVPGSKETRQAPIL